MKKRCLICGKGFETRPYLIRRGLGKYCSRICGGIARRDSREIVCEVCGKRFNVYKSRAENRKYCSRVCMGISERGKPSGMAGKKQSEKFFSVMVGRTPWNKGTKGVMKPNITSFKKGNIAWNKGLPFPDKVRLKMSQNKQNEKNFNWKGENAKKMTKHAWVRNKRGKAKEYTCVICNERRAEDWSNIDHQYRRVLEDYRPLCRKCHYKYDKENNR